MGRKHIFDFEENWTSKIVVFDVKFHFTFDIFHISLHFVTAKKGPKCELVVELGKKARYAKSVPCEPLVWQF